MNGFAVVFTRGFSVAAATRLARLRDAFFTAFFFFADFLTDVLATGLVRRGVAAGALLATSSAPSVTHASRAIPKG
jgi:hypothetical protein